MGPCDKCRHAYPGCECTEWREFKAKQKEHGAYREPKFEGREVDDARFLIGAYTAEARRGIESAFNLGVLIGIRLKEGFPDAPRHALIEKAQEVLKDDTR